MPKIDKFLDFLPMFEDDVENFFAEMFSDVPFFVSLPTIVTKLFISSYIFNAKNDQI